jgi:hypothetical protein
MQFTLTCRDEDGTLTRKEFDGIYLDDVVSKTQDFLHGVGFVFEELEVQTYPEDSKDDGEMSSEVQMLLEDDYRSIYNDNILDR